MSEPASSKGVNPVTSFLASDTSLKAIFIATVGGLSAVISFSSALSTARKNDNTKYDSETVKLHRAGSKLAIQALKWGSIYAIGGCSLLVYGIWKLSGAKNKEEFRMKMGSLFPVVPKNETPQTRTEFESLTDLMQYLDETFSTKPPYES